MAGNWAIWARRVGLCLMLLPLPLRADTVTVFAAASLKTALDRIAPGFSAATGHDLRPVLAGSSVLARQIAQGAPADVFISANSAWMDVLEAQDLLRKNSRIDLLGNRLVLIGRAGATSLTPQALRQTDGRIAMALTEAVPAGIYGQAAFETLGIWDDLAPRVVETDNVRAALALVALGAVPFGVTYLSDAGAEPRVTVLYRFAPDSHPPIRYPAARLSDSAAAQALMSYLQGDEARAIFTDQGFLSPGGSP